MVLCRALLRISGAKGENIMKLEFWQTVSCKHLTLARVCKAIDWQQPLPRCGEYVEGLDTLDGEQELPVRKLLHRMQDGSCLAELPGFNIAQLRLSYRELEQLAAKKGWALQKL